MVWSRSQVAGVGGAAGEDAVVVAEPDKLGHPGGWVVGVDGVALGHVQHRLDDWTWVWPTQWRSLAMVAAPRLLDAADREGGTIIVVGVEVRGVDEGVEEGLAGAWWWSWSEVWGWCVRRVVAVMMAMALILRTPSGLVSPSTQSWWATWQTRAWKSVNTTVSPVACRSLVPAYHRRCRHG